MSRKPNVNPHEKSLMALRIIRTWADFDIKNPEYRALNPRHVLDLCEEALEAAKPNPARGAYYNPTDAVAVAREVVKKIEEEATRQEGAE